MRKLWKEVARKAWISLDQALLGLCLCEMGMSLKEARQFLPVVDRGWKDAPGVEGRVP